MYKTEFRVLSTSDNQALEELLTQASSDGFQTFTPMGESKVLASKVVRDDVWLGQETQRIAKSLQPDVQRLELTVLDGEIEDRYKDGYAVTYLVRRVLELL